MPRVTDALKVDAVLFDYGLVLSGPPHPPAWETMKSMLGAGEAEFHAAYWRPRHEYDRGALTGAQYWRAVADELGPPITDTALRALFEADSELWTQPNQPMIDWVAALQAAGIRTGILSNIGDAIEEGVRARCPWLERFDHLTFSHRLHTAKPDLAIYRHAAQGLDVLPFRVLFIDDREDNIAAAREAGMQAMQYTGHVEFLAAMQAAGFGSLLEPATGV